MMYYGLVRTTFILVFLVGLLTYGSFAGHAFPLILPTVALYDHCSRLQRWPNVTDLNRIPFSPHYARHLKNIYCEKLYTQKVLFCKDSTAILVKIRHHNYYKLFLQIINQSYIIDTLLKCSQQTFLKQFPRLQVFI